MLELFQLVCHVLLGYCCCCDEYVAKGAQQKVVGKPPPGGHEEGCAGELGQTKSSAASSLPTESTYVRTYIGRLPRQLAAGC